MTVMIQFQSQFDAVDKATPRDRMGRGKTSPIKTQAPGPQVEAKKKMYWRGGAMMEVGMSGVQG